MVERKTEDDCRVLGLDVQYAETVHSQRGLEEDLVRYGEAILLDADLDGNFPIASPGR